MHSITSLRRDTVRFLGTHLRRRFNGADLDHELNAYLTPRGPSHCAFVREQLRWYEHALENDTCPMLEKAAWGARIGISGRTIEHHWKALRDWTINGAFVFEEGIHALRLGALYEEQADGTTRQITAGGIGLRTADMPRLPDRWSIVVVETTKETSRIMAATTHHAARNVEESAAATPAQKGAARAARVASLNPAGQLPLRIVATGTDAE